jgi:fucose permease
MSTPARGGLVPILLIGALFFLFGFVTWINGPLISYLKKVCELKDGAEPYYVTFAFYIAYFFTALPMAAVLRRTGLKRGMMYGLFVMALGALLFVPAAQGRSYPLFLVGLFTIGTGLSLLQTASNPYITVVGPIESAAARISVMGICNKLAGVLAPFVIGALLLGDAAALEADLDRLQGAELGVRLDELAARITMPYLWMAAGLVTLGVLLRFSPLPELQGHGGSPGGRHFADLFSQRFLVFGVIALFFYVGVEVIVVDTIGLYGERSGVPLEQARSLPAWPLMAMVISYVVGVVAIPRLFSQRTALIASAALGVLLSLAVVLLPPDMRATVPVVDLLALTATPTDVPLSLLMLALLGLANALMWPAIWPLAIEGLGELTSLASGLLIMAIAGGAVLPLLYGTLDHDLGLGAQRAYLLLVPGYLFIAWYALFGARRGRG